MSSKPSKQRKAVFAAPLHRKHKMLSAPLSEKLNKRFGKKSFPVRKGDTVKIFRGDFTGQDGKVKGIDHKHFRITVEGITREKTDGSTYFIPIHPSKVFLTKMSLDDKRRSEKLKVKYAEETKEEAAPVPEADVEVEEEEKKE
ncbi:MAG: 50S ribosomal protein L24 [Candidatus Bathyarchaeota archaeon]